jgi:hypothetical protein
MAVPVGSGFVVSGDWFIVIELISCLIAAHPIIPPVTARLVVKKVRLVVFPLIVLMLCFFLIYFPIAKSALLLVNELGADFVRIFSQLIKSVISV